IEHARVRPAVPGDERRGGRSLVEDVDPQELDPGSVAAGGLREVRGLLPARTAPGRPDVDDDRGPPELLEQGPVGVEVEARKRAHPGRQQRGARRVPRGRPGRRLGGGPGPAAARDGERQGERERGRSPKGHGGHGRTHAWDTRRHRAARRPGGQDKGRPAAAVLAEAFGISTVGQLLHHYPRRYIDRSQVSKIRELRVGQQATVIGKVTAAKTRPARAQRGLLVTTVTIYDRTGSLDLTFFTRRWAPKYREGQELAAWGVVE